MEDVTQIPASTEAKIPRIRSVAYPSIPVGDAVELTNAIYKIFGNITYTSREAIAKQLHLSESNLQTKISSCVQFGLLELKIKEGYRPTELFIKVRSPLPDERVEDLYAEIFSNPELYRAIIEQFNGKQLPLEAGLATILYRKHKVAEKVATYAAKVFIQSALECGYINDSWHLNVQPRNVEQFQEVVEDVRTEPKKDESVLYIPARAESALDGIEKSEIPPIPIFLDNGSTAKLYMPKGFTKEDLKRVAKVISAYID